MSLINIVSKTLIVDFELIFLSNFIYLLWPATILVKMVEIEQNNINPITGEIWFILSKGSLIHP